MIASFVLTPIYPDNPLGGWLVTLDGCEMQNHLQAITVTAGLPGPDEWPKVELTLQAVAVPAIDLPRAEVTITAEQAGLLQRLGWTPPPLVQDVQVRDDLL